MALVIEVLGRSRRSLQHFKIDSDCIRIGRGYENDVVLSDPYISIHHLRLDKKGQGWEVTDLDSLNGVQVVKNVGSDEHILESGSEIKLGRTRLRIVSDQLLQEAKPLHRLEKDSSKLNHWSVFLPLFIAFTGLELYSSYVNSFVRWEWKTIVSVLLTIQLGTLLIAGFWAIVGRFFRHETFFLAQYSLILIASLAVLFVEASFYILNYNTGFLLFGKGASRLLILGILVVLVSANLALSTHMSWHLRWLTSVGFAGIFLLVGLAGEIKRWGEFSPRPDYFGKVAAPTFLFVNGKTNNAFLDQTDSLFERAKKSAEESANN